MSTSGAAPSLMPEPIREAYERQRLAEAVENATTEGLARSGRALPSSEVEVVHRHAREIWSAAMAAIACQKRTPTPQDHWFVLRLIREYAAFER